MACPYFIPAEPHERELWPHRYRLSLGDGFAGRCGARPAGHALRRRDSAPALQPRICCSARICPPNREFDAVALLLAEFVRLRGVPRSCGFSLPANARTSPLFAESCVMINLQRFGWTRPIPGCCLLPRRQYGRGLERHQTTHK